MGEYEERARKFTDRLAFAIEGYGSQSAYDRIISELAAALRQSAAQVAVPEGYVLVPVEPTEAMYAAAVARVKANTVETWAGTLVRDPIAHTWIAMLAAAPKEPGHG